MFVVIQEIKLKKHNKYGAYKEYKVSSSSFTIFGDDRVSYSYYHNEEAGRFERPHLEAYKISIHHSYRDNGIVKKKRCVIGTIDYYTLATNYNMLYDYLCTGIDKAVKMFNLANDYPLYDMIMEKLSPIQDKVKLEFEDSEEYITSKKHDNIIKEYHKAKVAFAKEYQVDEHEYDYCFNVFGELMNEDYFNKIIDNYKSQQEYSKSSYYNSNSSNYNYSGSSSYYVSQCSTYNDEEKASLKQFYKALSKKFHPDLNPDTDTTHQMQLLNKLKDDWGI